MRLKLLAIVGLFAVADIAHGARISIMDRTVLPGDPTVIQVPILIFPDDPSELISGMSISFAAGSAEDAIPIVDADPMRSGIGMPEEFDVSVWSGPNSSYFGIAGTPNTHSTISSVTRIGVPLTVAPEGIIATYTIDVTSLPMGSYVLNPNFMSPGSSVGTTAFVLHEHVAMPANLTFEPGILTIVVPEPATLAPSALAALVAGLTYARRRSRRFGIA